MLRKFEETARQYPQRIAYRIGQNMITYGQLLDDMHHYGELLKKQGSSPVVLYGHKELFMIRGMMACLYAGRTYIPMEPYLPEDRRLHILNQSGAELILTETNLDYEKAAVMSLESLEQFSGKEESSFVTGPAYMIFTSGSTGIPKGVPISRRNLQNFITWISSIEPLKQYKECTVLNQASFSFDLSVADIFYSLWNGHTLMALSTDLKEDYAASFAQMKQADIAVMTPTFMKLCLLEADFCTENFPKLKCVYFCGEPLEYRMTGKLLSAFPELKVINAYGPTEAASAVSAIVVDKEMLEKERELPIGELDTAAVEITIENDEIVLLGESVADGYLGNITGGFFRREGKNGFRTGDVGWIKDGKLYCKGRTDSQIKYMGYRIELMDIERNLCEIEGVEDCVVTAKKTPSGSVRGITAFVVTDRLTAEEIRTALLQKLPEYMCPRLIHIIEEIPVNKNGKKDRGALQSI